MKKLKCISAFLLIVATILCIGGCSFDSTQSMVYADKMNKATEYSFNIVYTDSNQDAPIYISCFKKNGRYAYRFSKTDFNDYHLAYRQIYSENTFYEIAERKVENLWGGEYTKTENVEVNYEKNFMYKYTTTISVSSLITMLAKGTVIEYNGASCTEYKFDYDMQTYIYVFENQTNNLVKFSLESPSQTKTLEYSNYQFENIDSDCLEIPDFSISLGEIQLYREVESLHYEFTIG